MTDSETGPQCLDRAAAWLRETLDYEFNDPRLLLQALTHRSAPGANNERLEFLGDAILDVVISEVVYRQRRLSNPQRR